MACSPSLAPLFYPCVMVSPRFFLLLQLITHLLCFIRRTVLVLFLIFWCRFSWRGVILLLAQYIIFLFILNIFWAAHRHRATCLNLVVPLVSLYKIHITVVVHVHHLLNIILNINTLGCVKSTYAKELT